MTESFRLEFKTRLAMAKEEVGEMKVTVYPRNNNIIESQRRVTRNIQRMERKLKGESITHITTTNTDGVVTEYTHKIPMEKMIATCNNINFHQTEGGSELLHLIFTADLGTYGERPCTNSVLNGTYVVPERTSTATEDFLHKYKQHDNIESVNLDKGIVVRYQENKNYGI